MQIELRKYHSGGSSPLIAKVPVLLDPSNEIESLIDQRIRSFVWPSEDQLISEVAARPTTSRVDAFRLPYPPVPCPRINEHISPTGICRYGRSFRLVDSAGMQFVATHQFKGLDTINPTQPSEWDAGDISAITERMAIDGNTVETDVYSLAPISLDAIDGVNLWILPLVDDRYRLAKTLVEIRESDCYSWTSLFERLTFFSGIPIVVTAIDTGFGIPDVEIFAGITSLAVAIDLAALSIGCRAVFVRKSATVSSKRIEIQTAEVANTWLDSVLASKPVKIGGDSPDPILPAGVAVCGPISSDHYDDGQEWSSVAVVSNGTNGLQPISSHTSVYADFRGGSETGESVTARNHFLSAVGNSVAAWRGRTATIVMPGIQKFHESGCLDYVSFHVNGTDSVHTSAASLPSDFAPSFWANQWQNTYVHNKHTAVMSPRGGQSAAFAIRSSRYSAAPSVVDLVGFTGNVGDPLVTVHYQSGRGWIPISSKSSSGEIDERNFTLTTDMDNGEASGNIEGNAVTILDLAGVYPDLIEGCYGRARKVGSQDGGNETYQIVHASRPAKRYRGQLAENLLSTDTEGKIEVSPLTIQSPEPHVVPFPFEVTPGDPDFHAIQNPLKLSGFTGDIVEIVRNLKPGVPETADWSFSKVQFTRPTRGRGEVKTTFDSDDDITLENLVGFDSPFDDAIAQIDVSNIHEWEGVVGDIVRFELNKSTGEYEAYQKDCSE